MTARSGRPNSRSVEAYRRALEKYPGGPPLSIWQRYSLRVRVSAIYRLTHGGRDIPLADLAPDPPKG